MFKVIYETVFPKCIFCMSVPATADYTGHVILFRQMRYGCIVISRVKAHIFRQLSKAFFDFFQYSRYRSRVAEIGRFHFLQETDESNESR